MIPVNFLCNRRRPLVSGVFRLASGKQAVAQAVAQAVKLAEGPGWVEMKKEVPSIDRAPKSAQPDIRETGKQETWPKLAAVGRWAGLKNNMRSDLPQRGWQEVFVFRPPLTQRNCKYSMAHAHLLPQPKPCGRP